MDSDIQVINCKLRIIRHGGWCWGANQRDLIRVASQVLPQLVMERIAIRFQSFSSLNIQQLGKIQVKLSRREILNLVNSIFTSSGSNQDLIQRIDQAIKSSGLDDLVDTQIQNDLQDPSSLESQTAFRSKLVSSVTPTDLDESISLQEPTQPQPVDATQT